MTPQRFAKISKAVERWGAGCPFSILSRRRSSDRIREASMTLIQNSLANFKFKLVPKLTKLISCVSGSQGGPDMEALSMGLAYKDRSLNSSYGLQAAASFRHELLLLAISSCCIAIIILLAVLNLSMSIAMPTGALMLSFAVAAVRYRMHDRNVINPLLMSAMTLSFYFLCSLIPLSIQFLSTCRRGVSVCVAIIHLLLMSLLNSVPFRLRFGLATVFLAAHLALWAFPCSSSKTFSMSSNMTNITEHTFLKYHHQSPEIVLPIYVVGTFLAVLISVWLAEYDRKAQWACLASFKDEQEDVETMQDVNNLLIENILPSHVAQYFLSDTCAEQEDLYHESHEGVCVMFASIPNYREFWNEWDIKGKMECLRLLNEIIIGFDKLLLKPKYSGVEKIKTVGSTYMAAAGLTGRGGPSRQMDPTRCVSIMVDFAFAMMYSLEQINQDAFQSFQLRVGLSYGPVVAGVIGAQKPQYDIWSNTVNLASRMDSHGELGKIHATKEVANLLQLSSYQLVSRGKIPVKGVAKTIETYFILPKNL